MVKYRDQAGGGEVRGPPGLGLVTVKCLPAPMQGLLASVENIADK